MWEILIQQTDEMTETEANNCFHQICGFHCALEELWFPFPKFFRQRFTSLGYRCLSREYVARKIIKSQFQFRSFRFQNLKFFEVFNCFINFQIASEFHRFYSLGFQISI